MPIFQLNTILDKICGYLKNNIRWDPSDIDGAAYGCRNDDRRQGRPAAGERAAGRPAVSETAGTESTCCAAGQALEKILTHVQGKDTSVSMSLRPGSRAPPADVFG